MTSFVKKRKVFFIISICIVAVAILASFVLGVNADIHFKGGSLATYSFEGVVDKAQFTSVAEEVVGHDITIEEGTDINSGRQCYTIGQVAGNIDEETQSKLLERLNAAFPDNNVTAVSTSAVGSSFDKDFMIRLSIAVVLAFIIIMIYLGIRFRKTNGWSAGVFAILVSLHDIIIVYTTFVLCRIPLSNIFIAVVLATLGYSMLSTVVVYDRIRENRRLSDGKADLAELVDKSIHQSIKRTFMTTLFMVIALACVSIVALVNNANAVFYFSFPLLIGMIGCFYSSTCLTGTLWYSWQKGKDNKKK